MAQLSKDLDLLSYRKHQRFLTPIPSFLSEFFLIFFISIKIFIYISSFKSTPLCHFKANFYLPQCRLPNRRISFKPCHLFRKDVDFEEYTSYYTFYDDFQTKTIQPPIADFENNTIPHGNVRSVIQIYRERPIFFHLRNAAFRYQSSSYPIYLEDG